jgi:polyadenylate-binding protein
MTSASLYVGDLHPDVTEPMLFEIFSAVGPVASIRVCRDAVTRRSLGYAYVNFHNMVDAERALDTLNYSNVAGQPCRIMWKHRDPSIRKTGLGNVFIKNLDKQLDNRHLNDTFSAFGNIVSCKVAIDERGESKGYGYVQYETKEEADQAIQKVNGMLICDKKVFVGAFVPKQEREKQVDPEQSYTNVFVKNLAPEVDDAKLVEMFKTFGEISSAVIMKSEDGTSKCFGFVDFKTHESAVKSVQKMNGQEINDKILYCGRAEKKSRREAESRRKLEAKRAELQAKYQGVNLYVKNLDDDVDDEKIRTEFSPYGTIASAKVMTDAKGHSKGFGFVCFSSPDEATRAVTGMNGQMLGAKPIYVALHQPREVRKAQLQAQFAQRQMSAGQMQRMQMGGVPPQMQGQMFFPPGGGPRPGQMFMYPQQMAPQMRGQMYPGQMAGGRGAGQYNNQGQRRQVAKAPGKAPGKNQQFKMNPGVRNQAQADGGAQPVAAAAPQAGANGDITASSLAALPAVQQKQLLGEKLYSQIILMQPEAAGKITGMLLELDTSEVLNLIDTPQALQVKVNEAVDALKKFQGDNQ